MKHLFVIGEKEKHEIEVDRGWFGKITVRVDGEEILEKHVLSRGVFCKLKVGKEEKHDVELKYIGFFPKVRCFVNGRRFLGKLIPSTETAVGILLLTVIGVGFFSGFGGYFINLSEMTDLFASMCDGWADAFYGLNPSGAMEMRNMAKDLRNTARESHDYGIYCIVGALLVAIGGAGWMAWSFREKLE